MENAPVPVNAIDLSILRASNWQMAFGERAALEGLLSELRPGLAIELGTAQGGSLSRIASHSTEVHTFDLLAPPLDRSNFPNVAFHVGDSHQLLPEVLESLAQKGRNVDFILVDGDHSADGVRQDLEDLLRSPAVARSVILMHDTGNEIVRAGIERAHLEAYPKLAYLELDFVCGYIFREPSLRHELWGGLGLAVIDASRKAYFSGSARQARYYEAGSFLPEIRDLIARSEREEALESR